MEGSGHLAATARGAFAPVTPKFTTRRTTFWLTAETDSFIDPSH